MKKIGIFVCNKANVVCASCSCMNAFNERRKSFERYKDEEELILGAFFSCSHCEDVPLSEDKGFHSKIERLKKEGIDTIHFGVCMIGSIDKGCVKAKEMLDLLKSNGMRIIEGTH